MSSAFLMAVVSIEEGRVPDWKAARAAIAEWDPESADPYAMEQHFPVLEFELSVAETVDARARLIDAARESLAGDLDALRLGIGRDDQSMSWMTFRGVCHYITGGMSFGDSPTELFDAIARLDACGALDAARFLRE